MENGIHYENSDIASSAGSDPSGLSGGPKLSANLISRIEKLGRRRLDPGRIQFPKDAREFSGGHATVSKARMNRRWDNVDKPYAFRLLFPIVHDVAVKKMRIADDSALQLERALGVRMLPSALQRF